MRFPGGLQIGGWAGGLEATSLTGKPTDGGEELDVLKRRVHELHVQNEKLLDLVAEERLAKQSLEKELRWLREAGVSQAPAAPSSSAQVSGGLAGVFGFATSPSTQPPPGPSSAASEEAKLENDMLRTQLTTLRQAYEELQREKEGEKQGAAEDAKILQEQVRALKRALVQMQEGKDINTAADELMKAPEEPLEAPAPPPPPPPPPPSAVQSSSAPAMEVEMLREQLETMRKAYMELQQEHDAAAGAAVDDSDSDGGMGTSLSMDIPRDPSRRSVHKLAEELERLKIVEAALRQSTSEAEGRASKLQAQLAEEEAARRTSNAELRRLQQELEESVMTVTQSQAKSAELTSQLERFEALGADGAAKAEVAELTARAQKLDATIALLEQEKSEAAKNLQTFEDELTQASDDIEKLHNEVFEVTSREELLQQRWDDLQKDMVDQQRRWEEQAATHATQLEASQSQVAALQKELAGEKERFRVAELAQSESRAALSAAADLRIAELVAELEKLKLSSFAEVQARERELKHTSEQLQRELTSLRSDLEQTEESRRGLQRKLRECGDGNPNQSLGSFISIAPPKDPQGPGGMMYMLKIEELEAENARLSEQVAGASALYVPKIQELESDVREAERLLENAWESQRVLQEDVAAKAKMIRDLLRRCGYAGKNSSKLTRFLRVIPWASSTKSSSTVHAEDPSLSVEELEKALEKALLEVAQMHDALEGMTPGEAGSSVQREQESANAASGARSGGTS
mmetsp:Transcript_69667/g.167215  ORF Transcript_69667/g.167215 Transcript_69667/m.167215 type:complete len:749 (+) Transcript_69667:116-2362(+)